MTVETIEYVDPRLLKPDPNQPRRSFDEDEIEQMAETYNEQGVIIPIEVDGNNVIVLGERRWKAALKKELMRVPVLRKKGLSQKKRFERQLIDDAQRQDLSPQERVWAYATGVVNINTDGNYTIDQVKQMDRDYLLTLVDKSSPGQGVKGGQSELSRRIGVPQFTISTYLSFFKVGSELQKAFENGEIKLGYLYEVSKLYPHSKDEMPKLEKLVLEGKFKKRDEIRDYINKIMDKQVEAGISKAEELEPELKKPKTPEELEKAAQALKKEAERRKTVEQKAKEKRQKLIAQARKSLNATKKKIDDASKIIDIPSFRERFSELEKSLEQNPAEVKEQLIALGKEVTEAKKKRQKEIEEEKRKEREEKLRKKLEKESKKKAEKELLENKDFLAKAAKIAKIEETMAVIKTVELTPTIDSEEIKAFKESVEEYEKKLKEILNSDVVKKRGELFRNWFGHAKILDLLHTIKCPICEASFEKVQWICDHLTVSQAEKMLREEYQKSLGSA